MSRWDPVGAIARPDGVAFSVWAPDAEHVSVRVDRGGRDDEVVMERLERGYHAAHVEGAGHGTRYAFVLDAPSAERTPDPREELPDPASRWQPDGVVGRSAVVDPASLPREPAPWFGTPLERYVLYELHVGTFTPEGTFDAAIVHLRSLAELGVTAVELMPVGQFPGRRNWGYDGVFPYAAQGSYGGPEGIRRFVDACHGNGMDAVLDVVYNHLGPEGNVLPRFGPYVTDASVTPWGPAINFSERGSDEVRRFFIGNALWWLRDIGFDALRIDAIHGIVDPTAVPFLQELSVAVDELEVTANRRIHLIAESALNDVRVVRPRELGGLGLDAQWNDDFHHALRTVLTGERDGHFADFGRLEDLATAEREAFVHHDTYSAFRGRRHGSDARGEPGHRFVVFAQNHDQVGNRRDGDRPSATMDVPSLTLAAATVATSPFLPLVFMGEEFATPSPFPYFVDHADADLLEAVRRGRAEGFATFTRQDEPPDPAAETTFRSAVVDHGLAVRSPHAEVLACHRELLRLRREVPALARLAPADVRAVVDEAAHALVVRRPHEDGDAMIVLAFATDRRDVACVLPGAWVLTLATTGKRFGGPGTEVPPRLEIPPEGGALTVAPRAAYIYLEEAA